MIEDLEKIKIDDVKAELASPGISKLCLFRTYLKANREAVNEKKLNSYVLDSHMSLVQYTLFIPAFLFYFKEFGFFNISFLNPYRLMKYHSSQFNIARKLHVIFSSYSYYNTFTRLELQ